MNKKIAGFTSFLLCLCSVLTTSLKADTASEEKKSLIEITRSQIEEIEKHLSEQQGELFTVDAKEKDLLGEIERLERELASNRDALREVSSRIHDIEDAIKDGQNRVKMLNRSLDEAEAYLIRRIIALYKFGKSDYVGLLMSADTLQELEKTIRYMSSVMNRDREILDGVEDKRALVEQEVEELEENKLALELLRKEKDTRAILLERHMENRVHILMKARREKEFYEKAVKELRQAAQELNHTMGKLEKEEKGTFRLKGLAHMKGKLPLPLKGEILRDLHVTGSNPFMNKKGVFIKGSEGEEVRSVFLGRVDYSGWFKGYGQLMVVNHGARYFTLFAHLHKRAKEKGEMISSGEPVGIAGDPGWNMGSGVYFEIRKGSENLDPEKWLRVK
jgi:murein hydrolase activator